MNTATKIPCIAFDYGGTLDTNGVHWSEILWQKYKELHIPIDKDAFREAYIYGEKTLAAQALIKPEATFYDVLRIKCNLQTDFLYKQDYLKPSAETHYYPEEIAKSCYTHVKAVMQTTETMLEKLSENYRIALVSNFYGNLRSVLNDLHILHYFNCIIESASAGVRKPDPEIFRVAARTLGCRQDEMTVIGDSFSKDILPAHSIGCRTVWLKGAGWEEGKEDLSVPDAIITDIRQVPDVLKKLIHPEMLHR